MATGTGKDAPHPGRQGKQVRTTARRRRTPSRRPPSKRAHPHPAAADVEKTTLCAAGGNAKCVAATPGDHEGGGFSADEPWNRHMVQIPLLRPRKTKAPRPDTRSSVSGAASFTAAKTGKRLCPRTDPEDTAYTRDGASHEKNKTAVCNVDRRRVVLREGKPGDRQILYGITYRWDLK